MKTKMRKNQEFRNFKMGIAYFLVVALILFIGMIVLLSAPGTLEQVNFAQWSTISDSINLIIGLPIAFAGAYVAISIASRAADIAARQQTQENHVYYEGLHEQLIDNYYGITQAANRLVSASNRFEEAFYSLLRKETSDKYSVINFIDDEHKISYIQDMLVANKHGVTDTLETLHVDIKNHIQQLIEAIELAFKYSSVNETWNVSVQDPSKQNLLVKACTEGYFTGRFADSESTYNWLHDAKTVVMERLDLQEVSQSISEESNHPLLPFCFYISELNEFKKQSKKTFGSWSPEVLLAGYFLMTHYCQQQSSAVYFNSGALFLVDLITNLPTSEHIKLAFSKRQLQTETFAGNDTSISEELSLYQQAQSAYSQLDNDNKKLFSMLAENIQLNHYSPQISKTKSLLEKLLNNHQPNQHIPVLHIKLELLSDADNSDEDYREQKSL